MKRSPKKLLPPVLVVIAASTSSCRGPCGTEPGDVCLPDGDYACNHEGSGCLYVPHSEDGGVALLPDGGLPDCLC